jgi:HTH-type transcriptional regulator, competence development regulator
LIGHTTIVVGDHYSSGDDICNTKVDVHHRDAQEVSMAQTGLGPQLREMRDRRGRSLSDVATEAEISPAYLQKLEAGGVKQPSPNILHKLAKALKVDYAELMRLAGYVTPGDSRATKRRNELTYALSSEPLSEEEAKELARYLDWYREGKKRDG